MQHLAQSVLLRPLADCVNASPAGQSSADGGGMKGMATVRLLKELERHTGRRIHELFDLVGEVC